MVKRRANFILGALLLVADVVGVGIMEIPGNLARVGWVIGLPALLIFLPLNLYTGVLLGRLAQIFPDEQTVSYGALGGAVFGATGRIVVGVIVYTKILLALGAFLLVLTQGLQGVFHGSALCQPVGSLLAGLVLLPLNQLRTLSGVAIISAVSFVTVVLAIAICLVSLLAGANARFERSASEAVATHTDFYEAFAAGSGFVFAYVGHAIYLEIRSEMRKPERFAWSLTASAALIGTAYALVGVVGYASAGAETPSFLLDVLPYDWSRRAANALLFVHVLISYTISNQVLTRALLGCVLSATRCPALRHALDLGADAEHRAHVAVRDAAARSAALSDEGYLGASRAFDDHRHFARILLTMNLTRFPSHHLRLKKRCVARRVVRDAARRHRKRGGLVPQRTQCRRERWERPDGGGGGRGGGGRCSGRHAERRAHYQCSWRGVRIGVRGGDGGGGRGRGRGGERGAAAAQWRCAGRALRLADGDGLRLLPLQLQRIRRRRRGRMVRRLHLSLCHRLGHRQWSSLLRRADRNPRRDLAHADWPALPFTLHPRRRARRGADEGGRVAATARLSAVCSLRLACSLFHRFDVCWIRRKREERGAQGGR